MGIENICILKTVVQLDPQRESIEVQSPSPKIPVLVMWWISLDVIETYITCHFPPTLLFYGTQKVKYENKKGKRTTIINTQSIIEFPGPLVYKSVTEGFL